MKNKTKRLRISLKPFRFGVAVDFERNPDIKGIAATRIYDNYNSVIIFDIDYPIPIPSIAHELLHAMRYEFNKRSLSHIEKWDEETLPYCIAYCMGEILKYCEKNDISVCNTEQEIEK